MPTAKAGYKGDGTGSIPRDFSDSLKAKLRKYYPGEGAEENPVFGQPADAFVNELLTEARWATSQLMWQKLALTKPEIRAESADLLKTLKTTRDKLRSLSPDFDRLLGLDADPRGLADSLDVLISYASKANTCISVLPRKKRLDEAQHDVAVEIAIRVMRIAKDHGLKVFITGSDYFNYTSDAVQILKAIGDDIGLVLAALTWRDTIAAAKKKAADLQ